MERIFRNWDFLLLLIVLCLGIAFWRGKKEKKEIMPSAEENKISLSEEKEKNEKNEEEEIIASIRMDEISLARQALDKYVAKVCKEIDEKCKEIDKEMWNAADRQLYLTCKVLRLNYQLLKLAYVLISSDCKPVCNIEIIAHDIKVISKNSAQGRIVVKANPGPSAGAEECKYFNTVHREPYEFLATYGCYGDKWLVEDCKKIGAEWDSFLNSVSSE